MLTTEERPCEDMERRQPFASQGESPQDRPTLQTPWSWTSASRTVKDTSVLFKSVGFCYGSPSNVKCVCVCLCVRACTQCEEVIKIWVVSCKAKPSHWVNSRLLSHVTMLPRRSPLSRILSEKSHLSWSICQSMEPWQEGTLAPLLSTEEPETVSGRARFEFQLLRLRHTHCQQLITWKTETMG